jgi:hypothetical protein
MQAVSRALKAAKASAFLSATEINNPASKFDAGLMQNLQQEAAQKELADAKFAADLALNPA